MHFFFCILSFFFFFRLRYFGLFQRISITSPNEYMHMYMYMFLHICTYVVMRFGSVALVFIIKGRDRDKVLPECVEYEVSFSPLIHRYLLKYFLLFFNFFFFFACVCLCGTLRLYVKVLAPIFFFFSFVLSFFFCYGVF